MNLWQNKCCLCMLQYWLMLVFIAPFGTTGYIGLAVFIGGVCWKNTDLRKSLKTRTKIRTCLIILQYTRYFHIIYEEMIQNVFTVQLIGFTYIFLIVKCFFFVEKSKDATCIFSTDCKDNLKCSNGICVCNLDKAYWDGIACISKTII